MPVELLNVVLLVEHGVDMALFGLGVGVAVAR